MQIKFIVMFAAVLLTMAQKQATRSVLIFTDNAQNEKVTKQISFLKSDSKGVHDRDVTYNVITYSAANIQHYKKWGVTNMPFTVILIGKDNGEKMRSHEPVTLAKLFDLIDSMPMRKEEVRYKN